MVTVAQLQKVSKHLENNVNVGLAAVGNRMTIQEQYKPWTIFFAMGGLYPPGFETLVKNPWVQIVARVVNLIATTVGGLFIVTFAYLALFTNVFNSSALLILYLRRTLAALPLSLKVMYNFSTIGYRRMSKIYNTWNRVINNGYYVKKREKILAEKIKSSKSLFYFVLFVSAGLLQVPTLILFTGRNAHGAKLAYFPHDPYAWYHYLLVTLQFFTFFFGGLAGVCFNIVSYVVMLMANTQLEVLQNGLRDVFNGGGFNDSHVRQRLGNWILNHQMTNKWLVDVKAFFKFTSTIKFLFLGSYIVLAVFTLPHYLKEGRIVDIMFVLAYTVGNYCLLFFESRLADELHRTSSMLFMEAYDTNWYVYPRDIRQSFLIVHHCTSQKPFRIKAFTVYDSSETFLSILQSAYTMLSFLLRMDL